MLLIVDYHTFLFFSSTLAAELQCILANLIYRKYIKGYIAYKPRVLVLAKTGAFPDLSEVQLGDPFTL